VGTGSPGSGEDAGQAGWLRHLAVLAAILFVSLAMFAWLGR